MDVLFFYFITLIISFFILYFIIKSGVRNGILSAWLERERINALPPLEKLQKDYEDGKISYADAKLKKAALTDSA